MPAPKSPTSALADDHSAPDLEIVSSQLTIHPSGFTGGPEAENEQQITERNLVRHMVRFRENPLDFLREVSLYMSGTGWRAYDEPIGQPIFYSGFSERMKTSILGSLLLQNKVTELANRRLAVEEKEGLLAINEGSTLDDKRARRRTEIEGNLREVVDTMMENMICKMESKRFIRGAYYMCTQLLTRAYHQGKFPLLYIYHKPMLNDLHLRNSRIQRGSLAYKICSRNCCQEKAVDCFLALSQVPRGLRLPATYLLPSGHFSAGHRCR
jgi:hypothetical protein